MAKRSSRYEKARKALADAVEAMNILHGQHGKVLHLFKDIQGQLDAAQTEFKEAAKEDAAADPAFRSVDNELFSCDITESREVNVTLLQSQVSKTKFEKVTKVKYTASVSEIETAVKQGVLTAEEVKGVIKSKGFSASLKLKEA